MRNITSFLLAIPFAFALLAAFEDGASLEKIATNISHVVDADAGNAFDLGGGRTVSDMLDSQYFRY